LGHLRNTSLQLGKVRRESGLQVAQIYEQSTPAILNPAFFKLLICVKTCERGKFFTITLGGKAKPKIWNNQFWIHWIGRNLGKDAIYDHFGTYKEPIVNTDSYVLGPLVVSPDLWKSARKARNEQSQKLPFREKSQNAATRPEGCGPEGKTTRRTSRRWGKRAGCVRPPALSHISFSADVLSLHDAGGPGNSTAVRVPAARAAIRAPLPPRVGVGAGPV
jgi:hypothetical protein